MWLTNDGSEVDLKVRQIIALVRISALSDAYFRSMLSLMIINSDENMTCRLSVLDISERLNIDEKRANEILSNLIRDKVIERIDNGKSFRICDITRKGKTMEIKLNGELIMKDGKLYFRTPTGYWSTASIWPVEIESEEEALEAEYERLTAPNDPDDMY